MGLHLAATLILIGLHPCAWASGSPHDLDRDELKRATATIVEKDVRAHVDYLASPLLEGRDSPSVGQLLAARHIAEVFQASGLSPAPDALEAWRRVASDEAPAWSSTAEAGTFLRPFEVSSSGRRRRPKTRPIAGECALVLAEEGGEDKTFRYGRDFVPLAGFGGECLGELVWAGFGIQDSKERYDDLRGVDLEHKIALLIEGEPAHKRKFDGAEVTAQAAIWNKLATVAEAGAAGAIIVRRPRGEGDRGPDAPDLSYRYSYASFIPPSPDRRRGAEVPAIEVTVECASQLLDADVEALMNKIDRTGKPVRVKSKGRQVSFDSAVEDGPHVMHNVVAVLPGSDPVLAREVVVVGAHYDHIGVGLRGRIGFGADDNASGTSALLEVSQAFAGLKPRRTIMFAAFAAEEDGLIGSERLASEFAYSTNAIVAMVNMDMLGRGDRKEVVCLGFEQNPGMKKLVGRANKLGRTGIRRVTTVDDPGLFKRSDHYSFHQIGVPVVFMFEGYPLEKNKDYHTWRDVPDLVDAEKVAATARLAFLTTWLLANEDDRLPPPGD